MVPFKGTLNPPSKTSAALDLQVVPVLWVFRGLGFGVFGFRGLGFKVWGFRV